MQYLELYWQWQALISLYARSSLCLFGGYSRCLDGFRDLLGPSDRYTVASSCEGFNAVVTQTILVLCFCSLVGDYQLRNSANSRQEKQQAYLSTPELTLMWKASSALPYTASALGYILNNSIDPILSLCQNFNLRIKLERFFFLTAV